MPRDGSGGFQLPANSWSPALNGNAATPNDWNATREDLRSAIEGSVSADGQTPMTGDLKMGNNRVTGLGSPSGDGHALRFEQLKKGPNIASASTITIPMEGALFDVTGSTQIEVLGGSFPGRNVYLRAVDGTSFKRSASILVPGGYDLSVPAGSTVRAVCVAASVWLIDSFVGQSLPIFPTNALPTVDVGPIWAPGIGDMVFSGSAYTGRAMLTAKLPGNQNTTSNVWTKLVFGVQQDTDAIWDAGNTRPVAKRKGLYEVSLMVQSVVDAGSDNDSRVYVNGSDLGVWAYWGAPTPTNAPTRYYSRVVQLDAGDYLDIYQRTTSTGAFHVTANTHMALKFLRDLP